MNSTSFRAIATIFAATVALNDARPDVLHPIINGIVGGQPDTASIHAASVALVRNSGSRSAYCSGTYVGARTVVTAAHCLVGVLSSSISAYFGLNTEQSWSACQSGDSSACNSFISATEHRVHPSYAGDFGCSTSGYDIGVIRLAEEPVSVEPIPHLRRTIGLTDNDEGRTTLIFSGFGRTETEIRSQKMTITGVLAAVGGKSVVSPVCRINLHETEIYYTQEDGGPCFGDSGGPAFVYRGSHLYLAGITSWGDIGCAQFGVSSRVDRLQDFIDDFMAEAGGWTPDTTPPVVAIEHPTDSEMVVQNGIVATIDAADNYAVAYVSVLLNDTEIGRLTEPPYTIRLNALTTGDYRLRAQAVDIFGNISAVETDFSAEIDPNAELAGVPTAGGCRATPVSESPGIEVLVLFFSSLIIATRGVRFLSRG